MEPGRRRTKESAPSMRLPRQAMRGVLSPADRASEVLFGLIMALTLTGGLSVTEATERETRAMFLSTLGCNVAWGLVDAVMYVMNGVVDRARRFRLARALREGSDIPAVLAELLPESPGRDLTATQVETLVGHPERTDPMAFELLALDERSGDNTLSVLSVLHGQIPNLRTLQDVDPGFGERAEVAARGNGALMDCASLRMHCESVGEDQRGDAVTREVMHGDGDHAAER